MKEKSIKEILGELTKVLRGFLKIMGIAHRGKITEITAYEERELENIFILLLLGSFSGIPSPPAFIAVELFPYLQHELRVLEQRAQAADDALSELAGLFDID